MISFEKINAALRGQVESLVTMWLPDGERRNGHDWFCKSPGRTDSKIGSFSVNLVTGQWNDFASDDRGRDLISLYAFIHGIKQGDAARELAGMLGLDGTPAVLRPAPEPKPTVEDKTSKKNSNYVAIVPVPESAGLPKFRHFEYGVPVKIWEYRDRQNRRAGYVCRFERLEPGDQDDVLVKITVPYTFCRHKNTGVNEWRWKQWDAPRPLLGSQFLDGAPDFPVLVVEGEKCWEAAHNNIAGYVAISWSGGCKSVEKSDWQQLAGREVVIWPDADAQRARKQDGSPGEVKPLVKQPGYVAATKIASLLLSYGCRVSVMLFGEPDPARDGFDIVDVMEHDGVTGPALVAYIRRHAQQWGGAEAAEPVAEPVFCAAEPDLPPGGAESLPPPPPAGLVAGGGDGGRRLWPFSDVNQLQSRFALIFGQKGEVFDFDTKRIINQSDVQHACKRKAIYDDWCENRMIVYPENVGFDPSGRDELITCNFWDGFAIEPKKGDCSYLLYLLRYMCEEESNCDEVYEWILRWLALPLQRPGTKLRTTIIVKGPQGVGKNLFFESYMSIYGSHGAVLNQAALEDDFNDWAIGKLFVIADEVVSRNEAYELKNKLKNFVTGDTMRVNAKNRAAIFVANLVNSVYLSNEQVPQIVEWWDRRNAVIRTPEKLSDEFYQLVAKEIKGGGIAALYDFLLNLDLQGFNEHSKPPMTEAKKTLITLCADSYHNFWEELCAGELVTDDEFEILPIPTGILYAWYQLWCERKGVRPGPMSKFEALLVEQRGCAKARMRYLIGMTAHQATFIVPPKINGQMREMGDERRVYLGGCIEKMSDVFDKYRENRYGFAS
jgi:Family of unknown function (DUF5906)